MQRITKNSPRIGWVARMPLSMAMIENVSPMTSFSTGWIPDKQVIVLLSVVVFDELFQFAEEKEEALCVAVKIVV